MIKLIITDLDGTLLNDSKQLPADFWNVERELHKSGVQWVIASGRQYYTIADQFSPILDDVYILAENGSLVMYGDRQIHINPLDRQLANDLILKGRKVKDAWPILCGRNSAYVEDTYQPLLDEAQKYYKRLKKVDDLTKVDDIVLKYTLCDFGGAEQNSFNYFKDVDHICRVAIAGKLYLDMTNLTASKGTALKEIMKHSNVKPEEVMAFGDYMNDIEMMEIAGHSFAMKNSHPDLFETADTITEHDNNNDGVIVAIKEYFKLA